MGIRATKVKISQATFLFIDSRGGFCKDDDDEYFEYFSQETISANQFNLEFNQTFTLNPATALYSGPIMVTLGNDPKKVRTITFRQSEPLPVTIASIYLQAEAFGEPES